MKIPKVQSASDVLKAINRGRADITSGNVHSMSEMRKHLHKIQAKWRKQK